MKRFSLYQVFAKAHAHLAARQLNRPVFHRQRGASGIEYVVIAAMVVLAIVVFVPGIQDGVTQLFTDLADSLPELETDG
ncbi:Flp family type IVb pilin [Halomonas sp. HG01]|uniref:Flp family type IVb pilin n=1 Tax=Halomonas sp. HG01 TaxID=1609967 RepID=UPI00128B6A3D|nr:Flp family type IVb pilin [Halomonas sp. HG01]